MNSLQKLTQKKNNTRYAYHNKMPKNNQITMIKQNLEIMKNSAHQFLKKGNKQLPPITKARHYLIVNYFNQSLYSPDLSYSQNKKPDFLFFQDKKQNSKLRFYHQLSQINSISPKREEQSMKQLRKSTLQMRRQQKGADIARIFMNKNFNTLQSSKKAVNIKNFDCRLSNSIQYQHRSLNHSIKKDNNIVHLNNRKNGNIQNLQKTQKASGQIIKYLHQKNQFLIKRQSKHQQVLDLSISKNEVINHNQQSNLPPLNTLNALNKQIQNTFGANCKQKSFQPQPYLFIEKIPKSQQLHHINPETLSNQQYCLAVSSKLKQYQNQVQNHSQNNNFQLLSSDSIQINKWKLTQNLQTIIKPQIQNQKDKFNPLRSLEIKNQNPIYQTFIRNDFKQYSLEMSKKIQYKQSPYKQILIQQIQNEYNNINKSRYYLQKRQAGQSSKLSKSLYSKRFSSNPNRVQKKNSLISTKQGISKKEANKEDNWEPWKHEQKLSQLQELQFQNQVKQQF